MLSPTRWESDEQPLNMRGDQDSEEGAGGGTPFVGRAAELSALRAILCEVRSGQPRTVLVEGPSGIGKTALIERFLLGEEEVQVLRASGEQWEALVAYGVIDQLLRVAGVSGGALFARRERALPTEEPVSVGAWILEVLEDLEKKAPLALVIDDAHWADMDSLRALLFALRRLVNERVLTVLTVREEDAARLPEGLRRLANGTSGATLRLRALETSDIHMLAAALGVPGLTARTAERLHDHTHGNPLYVSALLSELPADRWRTWEPSLPAPSGYAAQVMRRLDACGPAARRLVEAASVLGVRAPFATAAALARVEDPLAALEEASVAGLLQARDDVGVRDVVFPHPLVQAAVYGRLGPARRAGLHRSAAALVQEDRAALRHRVAAATPPDPDLAAELDAFAGRYAASGAWAGAASVLVEASQLSATREEREQRLLRAVDAMVSAGDLVQASSFARDVVGFAPGGMRDGTLGYLAVLRGRPTEAEHLLESAWGYCDPARDPGLAAVVAQRWALHSVGRLRGAEIEQWAERSIALAAPDATVRVEAEALLGLGLGWSGRVPEGLAAYESILDRLTSAQEGVLAARVRMAQGWLRLVVDDIDGARATLTQTVPTQSGTGSIRIAVWASVWLSRAEYSAGAWDKAAMAAERAVSLLEESGHEWLRPLARWAAVGVPAARGEWQAAEEHAGLAAVQSGDYELMIVAEGLARAEVAAARGDHEAVLRALEPLLAIRPREGIDEPGFWPWQDLYGDALVSTGRWEQAEAFLAPHEELAAARGRRSSIARFARVRGRVEAAAGRVDSADAAFRRGSEQLEGLRMPFQQALLELTYGQMLRRHGRRRAAADQLHSAHDRFLELRARPYLELSERELRACGLAPAKRLNFDPSRLTAQELAVARLVAAGMSNREVASELFISIKTVQFHLTHVYSKLRVGSRAELAAHLKDLTEDEIGPANG